VFDTVDLLRKNIYMDENDLNNPFASKPMPGIGLEKLEEHKELPDPLATPELPIRPDVVEIPEHNSSGKRIGFVSKILWIGVLFVAGIGLSLLYQQLINRSNEELINRNDIIRFFMDDIWSIKRLC